jgi:hypothetical protein
VGVGVWGCGGCGGVWGVWGWLGCVGCVGCVGGVGVGGCGGWGLWAVWGCGVTPYVRHSTDCTCCDFGHLRFYIYFRVIQPRFNQILCNIYLFSNWVDHLSFFGYVAWLICLICDMWHWPLDVTNILGSGTKKYSLKIDSN